MAGSFRMVDNRRALEAIRVEDPEQAKRRAGLPISEIDPDAKPFKASTVPEITYSLDRWRLAWGEFLGHHAAHKVSKGWLDMFKPVLSGAVGEEPTLLTYESRTVARFRRDGLLNLKLLGQEQPAMVAKYTKMKWVEVFDKEAFEAEEPLLYAAYRARRLTLVSGAVQLDALK